MGFDVQPSHLIPNGNQPGLVAKEDTNNAPAAETTVNQPPAPPAPQAEPEQEQPAKKLDDMSLPELKEIGTAEGMVGVDAFDRKAGLIAAIVSIRAIKAQAAEQAKLANVAAEMPQQTPTQVKASRADEQKYLSKREIMKRKVESAPKVMISLPLDGDKPGAVRDVTMNGYTVYIPKGKLVEVSRVIVDYIQQMDEVNSHIGEEFLMDRTDPRTGKPMVEVLS